MPIDKSAITKGMFMTGGANPVLVAKGLDQPVRFGQELKKRPLPVSWATIEAKLEAATQRLQEIAKAVAAEKRK